VTRCANATVAVVQCHREAVWMLFCALIQSFSKGSLRSKLVLRRMIGMIADNRSR
jgi:hypothetical protein